MSSSSTSETLSWLGRWHRTLVSGRRARVLAELLAARIPKDASILDIGCGDGTIASLVASGRPDVSIQGVEFAVRPACRIPCTSFDGMSLPFASGSFEGCLLVDVLHHTDDVTVLLKEATRVSRSFVLVKDHLCENALDHATLRLMDWVGNRPHGVRLTYNYQTRESWTKHFASCGLRQSESTTRVPLYPFPFSLVAGRGLHFVTRLEKTAKP